MNSNLQLTLASKMKTSLLIGMLVLLSSCISHGYRPHSPGEKVKYTATSKVNSVDSRNDAKLKLLNSLLEAKTMEGKTLQDTKKTKMDKELEVIRQIQSKEPASKLKLDKTAKEMSLSQRQQHSAKDLLIEEILNMSEERAAELARSLMKNAVQAGVSEHKPEVAAQTLATETALKNFLISDTGEISNVSRLVTLGYNLIRGSPEGEFEAGGNDVGIKPANQIFKFTFKLNSSFNVPDQVNYTVHPNYNQTLSKSVYVGGQSYRDGLADGVSASGLHQTYKFSGSTSVSDVHGEASSTESVFLDTKHTCTLGQLRYIDNDPTVQKDVSDEFFEDVQSLPIRLFGLTAQDSNKYFAFFDKWGTDIIRKVDIGFKYITRHRANYTVAMQFAKSGDQAITIDSDQVSTGSITMDLDTIRSQIKLNPNSRFGSYESDLELGSEDDPIPVKLYLEPITRALDERFWRARFGDSTGNATAAQLYNALSFRKLFVEWQLADYSKSVGSTLSDPVISVPLEWPQGTYSLPQTTSGCPVDFLSGCRTQDNEDTNNQNRFSDGIAWDLHGEFDTSKDEVETCYCSKTESGNSIFTWMPGQYCIARKGGPDSCPAGFSTGYIQWDDEDTNNHNAATGTLPDGTYSPGFTIIDFCCRDDGDPKTPIVLPNTQPFVLYPYKDKVCQEVHQMVHEQHFVFTDDEDVENNDKCVNNVPYVPNKCNVADIEMTYCYYQPK